MMTRRDLERYLSFYAPRIKEFYFPWYEENERGHILFSNDAFLALQMATNYVPGALSPNLRKFNRWLPQHVLDACDTNIHPFMSLFLGKSVTLVNFWAQPILPDPLLLSAIQHALTNLPGLQEITLNYGHCVVRDLFDAFPGECDVVHDLDVSEDSRYRDF